uniref:Uncharacterized protein n=1 Tax=Paramoeba aestuarina TaxID=180227 RepID=A0A7S4P7L0_9EUKA|eukprot:CAMPEP_0201511590 /NCGR_PEP_ID=MMETSP0161_2-20130828/4014_1 /ASSEMBLY_ACC=CAM_ASM_000251 /TAXON_ID=180227 /ORGANISM="Neoparamoeba aestuarina, Strain SoJaBio B1-5/56/2" /LENGTH=213 /DNA_ID=CAMNT_0047907137 /DNA_START=105 /DNA_END=746 /DNA_ORIENTATION=+
MTSFLSCVFLVLVLHRVNSQLYGKDNCGGDNSDNYCGPANVGLKDCTKETDEAALKTLVGYLGGIGFPADNYSKSIHFTTGDGDEAENIPPFTFNWHGSKSLIPIAGTYVGRNALAEFFGKVNSLTTDFAFSTDFYPPGQGVLIPSYNCLFCIAQWQENGVVVATGKTFSNAPNTVRYTMLNATYNKIAVVDVFTDNSIYQDAFCAGEVVCQA